MQNIKDNFIGNKFPQNCGDEIVVLKEFPERKNGKVLFECEFKKYPCKILALKGNILAGKVNNPQIEQVEFIDKLWPQKCGDVLKIIKKEFVEKYKRFQFVAEFQKYPYQIITDKKNIIEGKVVNPEIDNNIFVGKYFKQRCGDILKVITKTNKQVRKNSNYLYECEFQNYPYKILETKSHILEGCVNNPRIEIEEFQNKLWPQNCGDILKVIKKTEEKRGGEKEFYWLCEFINYPYQIKALKDTVKAGQIVNPNLPWKSKEGIISHIKQNFPNKKPTLTELGDSFGIARVTIGQKINKFGLKDYISYSYLGTENYLKEYIKSLGFECYSKVFSSVKYEEIDCLVPNLKIGFEFNGNYWHSELFLERKYHQDKQLNFKNIENIDVFNIFEYEWQEKEFILKSYIRSKLGIFDKKIGARQCEIRELKNKEYQDFCNQNHLQGECGARTKLGLFYKNELIQIMSFGSPRFTNKYEWEILRECSKLGYLIIGGKQKLWKYFVQHYSPENCISYCDYSKFRGESYLKLGFKQESLNLPGFVWYDDNTKQVFWRNPFNHQEMKEKYYKIYDCGQLVFTWKKKEEI